MYSIFVTYPDGKTCQIDSAKNIKEVRKSINSWFNYFVSKYVPKDDKKKYVVSKTELICDEGRQISFDLIYNSVYSFLSVSCSFRYVEF